MRIFAILLLMWACASNEILYVVDADSEERVPAGSDSDKISILEKVGSEGGTLEATNETGTLILEIPAGALEVAIEIGIEEIAFEELYLSETLESLIDVAGGAYVFTPHGTTFAAPVAITLPQTGIADTILRLDDEYDMTWEMAPGASFTANQASFQTSTFSVYFPISVCKTYCDNVEQLCSDLRHETCLESCQAYNISNPPLACTAEVTDNFVCLTDARLDVADFDCTTGEPLPTTCPVEQMEAQDCTTGECSDLSGAWYVRIVENGETWTTNDLSGDPITLVVEGEGDLVAFASLSPDVQEAFPLTDYASVYQVRFGRNDVYGIPLSEDAVYPDVFLSEDGRGELQVALVTDSLVTATPSQTCTPGSQSVKFSIISDDTTEISLERDLSFRDGDGDGIGFIGGDCNDSDANIYPGAAEILADGIDQDCNGTVIDTAPRISSSDGVHEYNDSVLTCSAIGSDFDGQTLSYSYSWIIDGGSYSGAIQDLSDIAVQPGAIVECTVMVSDTNGGTTQDSTTLTLDNRAPLVNSVSISPNTGVLSNTELTCLATVSDPDGESLSASYEWFRSGVPIGSNGVLQLSNTLVVPNDSVECVATVNDGFGGSNSDTSSVSVDNSAPSIDSSLLSLISPTRTDIITCSAAASDLDGGIPALLFVFTNQGTGVTYTATSSTADSATLDLSGTAIEYDEVVSCEITATDLDGGSVSATETATIINSVPVFAAEASISPNILVYTGTELTCSATATDADDGSLTLTYLWTNGSTQIGSGSSYTVLSDDTDVGDTINCTSTAIDANQFSITSQASVIVENTDPTVSNVQITGGLGAYYNNETVICSASTDDIDEIPTVSYVWSIAGVDLGYADSLDLGTTSLLPADSLTCTVSISDSNGGFASAFASISVGNREPSTPTVVISWTANGTNPIDTDELTCVGAGSTDLDGDSVSYTYSWTSDLGGSVSGNTVLSSVTSPSETWTCSVIASDGSLNSSTGVSSTTISCLMADYETLNLGNGVDLEMESICSGTDPLGRYTLTNDFYLMTTEVTQRMFTELMNYNQSTNYGVGDNYPYYFVNWHMSADFANKVTQRHNTVNSTSLQECYTCLDSGTTSVTCSEAINPYQCTGYVLPTEGEWEYAARSGTLYDFWTPDGGGNYSSTSCGDGVSDTTVTIVDGFTNPPLSDYAWFCGNRHDSIFTNTAKPVGLKLPNEFGLYDMHGNVWEWTTDSYGCSFSGNDDPYCSLQVGSNHVSRGGAWSSDANAASASNSLDTSPSNTFFYIGFRLAFHP